MQTPDTPTWTFFRRHRECELWCAVRSGDAVPAFLLTGAWRYAGHLLESNRPLPGFDPKAAATFGRMNGFYLFQVVGKPEHLAHAGTARRHAVPVLLA